MIEPAALPKHRPADEPRRLDALLKDERGDAMIETLIAFPVLLFVTMALYMFTYQCTAHLVLKRAASAAARAAIVFLPDDPRFYGGAAGAREGFVREAARRVMLASAHFAPEALRVNVTGTRSGFSPITATVETEFNCGAFVIGSLLCGLDKRLPMRAQATLPYQGF